MPRLLELSTMSVAVMSNNVVFERIRDGTTKGAMLTMLAEVASQALLANDEDQSSSPSPSQSTVKKKRMREITVEQALSLSTNHLLKIFARFEGDEMKRSFSYECLMIPTHCSARFSSFGSESKARHMIREHLHTHLYCLNPGDSLNVDNKEDFSLKKLTNTVPKTSKKCKLKYVDENPEAVPGLQNEHYFKNEVQIEEIVTKTITINSALTKCLQNTNSEDKLARFDHNYHRPSAPNESLASSLTNEEEVIAETLITEKDCLEGLLQDQFWNDMPVVAEEVVIKTEIRVSEEDDEEEEIEEILSTYKPRMITTKTIKSEDLPVLQDNRTLDGISTLVDPEAMREYMHIERDEHRVHKKPKGKAKFIGQSAAEKEMAVHMIETMKLKQGSGEPLECQICIPPRVFTAPTTLISHYRSHAGIKPYECHLCGSVFTRQHSLNYHLLIHSNKTRFTCEDCGRKFRHPSHFKEHQRRHTGEAPFECSDCMSRFKTRNTYKRHLKTRHGKVLTQSGGIIILSDEEFRRVRTSPRSPQTRIVPPSNDKENNRRIRGKVANILRRGKTKKNEIIDDDEEEKTEKCIPTITHWNSENIILRDVDSSDIIFEETTEDSIMDTSESIVNLEYGECEENIPTTVMLVATATFPSNVLNDSLNT